MKRIHQTAFLRILSSVIQWVVSHFESNTTTNNTMPLTQNPSHVATVTTPNIMTGGQAVTTTAIISSNSRTTTTATFNAFNCIPNEAIFTIFQQLPLETTLSLRQVCNSFNEFWEYGAKYQLRALTPAIHALNIDSGFAQLLEKQQIEVNHFLDNEKMILQQNPNNSALSIAMQQLKAIKDNKAVISYHQREHYILSINELIVRNKIKIAQECSDTTTLSCFSCFLTRLPETVFNDNKLKEFWDNLTWLNIYGNQLSTLPESIGRLAALRVLIAFDNQLSTLPDSIGQLAVLRVLIVVENQLRALPKNLRDGLFHNEFSRQISKQKCLDLQRKPQYSVASDSTQEDTGEHPATKRRLK